MLRGSIYDIVPASSTMKISDVKKFLGQVTSEQKKREENVHSKLLEKLESSDIELPEADEADRNNRLLFLITTEIEDTETTIRETEQVLHKLKKHLQKLKDLQSVLSK